MKALKYIGITMSVLLILGIGFAKYERIAPISMLDQNEINTNLFSDIAINGYDAVAYHTEKMANPGIDELSVNWRGAKWLFSTLENRNLFENNPERYAPLFGGYCVFAISKGVTANTDPEVFEVMDEKLILFASKDVHAEWMKNPAENLESCTTKWRKSH